MAVGDHYKIIDCGSSPILVLKQSILTVYRVRGMEEGKPLSLEKARTLSMIMTDVVRMEDAVEDKSKKRTALRDLDCFVLDNSICESTVGQLRGHTLENKWKIFNEVKKCGIEHVIVAAFSHMTRVDDEFIRQLGERGEDLSTLYAFTEVTESIKNGVPDKDTVPVGMRKMKAFGLRNPIVSKLTLLTIMLIGWENSQWRTTASLFSIGSIGLKAILQKIKKASTSSSTFGTSLSQ